ncbi:MAG: 23S rRNA (adenine(2503)-C(2))-methyltransferase RlmN [Clostridia bacterium]|nr:23S rRNA (adenine(2503)-C(2))-methyltransferase RlmN [Clostridia bacterium]
MKAKLLDLSFDELVEKLTAVGLKKYQAESVFVWLNKGYAFEEMTDIAKGQRELLKEFIDIPVSIAQRFVSRDGTQKFLFGLTDGEFVEGVLMKYKYGYTLCVSTQIGCNMGCVFCASHLEGKKRDLSSGEILGQVICVNRMLGGDTQDRKITNVVLMGMGEPLDNFDNVLSFLYNVNHPKGLNIAMRNISLSTCGIAPKIYELMQRKLQINLTVSLHEAFQDKRERIMPVAKAYDIESLIKACRDYFQATGRRVIFEYTLIKGVNDAQADADELARLLKGFPAHINLIKLNPVKETGLKGTTDKEAKMFADMLAAKNMSVTVRRQMGVDIEGACGQLRRKATSLR